MRVGGFIENTSAMMLTSLLFSFLFGGIPSNFPLTSGNISMIALIIMMTFSLSSIDISKLKISPYRSDVRNAFLFSFGLLTGFTILISFLFNDSFRYGWVLEAAVPSAVSIVSFTYIWGGNTESSAVSSIAVYVISLGVTPLITYLFLGKTVSEITLLYYVSILIILPLALSPIIKRIITSIKTRNRIINIAFFFLIISIVGANRDIFFVSGMEVIAITFLAIIRIFGTGLIIQRYCVRKQWPKDETISGVLFATYKNSGMAGALALVMIGPEAAIPPAICTIIEVIWLIFAGRYLFHLSTNDKSLFTRKNEVEQ